MFILAFFGFLRCSELAISSSFDPAIHPTISDLVVLDDETISYTIKQSKTDQTKKGHFILHFQTPIAFITIPNPPSFPPPKEITVQTPIRPPLHRRLQPPRHSLLVPKAPQGSPAPIRYPSRKLFQPFIPNRRSNHSGPQRPFPTADPRTRSLVVRGFQKLHSTKPLPHQGSPPDPNRPPPLEYPIATAPLHHTHPPPPPPPPPPNPTVFPTAAAVPAPAGAFSVFPPLPQQCLLPKEPFLYFPTAPAVIAPAGALSVFPHCRSSARSNRSLLFPPPPHPNPTVFFFPHCRSSARSRRSFLCISTIAAAVSTPEGAFSVFPLDAAVTAPAGELSVFHHYRCSDCSPQERYLYFLTAPAVIAPAGALSVFPHCRSSARSSRSLLFSPPPSPLPAFFFTTAVVPAHAGTFSIFPTTAVVPAPAGSFSIFPHCPSSDRSRRSTSRFVPTTAVVSAPAGALSLFPLPQQ